MWLPRWKAPLRHRQNGHANGSLAAPPRPPAPGPSPNEPDYAIIRSLQNAVSDELSRLLAGREYVSASEREAEGRQIASQRVSQYVDQQRMSGTPLSGDYEQRLLDGVLAALLGLGRSTGCFVSPSTPSPSSDATACESSVRTARRLRASRS
ncbi:hypothetical protein [Salinispora arenicola]|uniref:hypothetical protein n=1 Tax=Salinispora arenicola TaxID=168697 RepID=UPI0016A70ADF|nr:hypothetical protein [Salinispora arenicola]NIL64785.1 hypothetical protein [Salinispora arenicola]